MCGWIALEFIGKESPRNLTLTLQHFAKEPFSSSLVPSFRHQNVENIAVLIDYAPETELLSLNLHENLVHIPGIAQSTLLLSEPSSELRPELQTPEADGFVRNNDATLGQQIFDIPKAEREPMVQPHGVTDNFRRKAVPLVTGFHARIVADHTDCGST